MTELHTPVVEQVRGQGLERPLHRAHGGMDHILPIGLEEVPPVGAGGNGVLTGTSGEGVVCDPLAIAGGIVINSRQDIIDIHVKLQKLKHMFHQIEDMIYELDESLTQSNPKITDFGGGNDGE